MEESCWESRSLGSVQVCCNLCCLEFCSLKVFVFRCSVQCESLLKTFFIMLMACTPFIFLLSATSFYCHHYFSLSSFPLNLSHLCLFWHTHTIHTLFHPKLFHYFFLYALFSPYSVHAKKEKLHKYIDWNFFKQHSEKSDILKSRLLLSSVYLFLFFFCIMTYLVSGKC